MTAAQDRSADLCARRGLGAVLRAAHNIWITETDAYLTPIIVPKASFWERWTAVRYLADDFVAQYRHECALLDELRAFLPGDVANALLQQGERIGQLQQQLDRIGRRRGTAQNASVTARLLLDSVRVWCAGIEAGARHIDRVELPQEAKRVLSSFELYSQVHG